MSLDKYYRFEWESNAIIVEFSLWEERIFYNPCLTDDTNLTLFRADCSWPRLAGQKEHVSHHFQELGSILYFLRDGDGNKAIVLEYCPMCIRSVQGTYRATEKLLCKPRI